MLPSSRHFVTGMVAGDDVMTSNGDPTPLGSQYGDSPSQLKYYNMLYKWRAMDGSQCPRAGNLTDAEVRRSRSPRREAHGARCRCVGPRVGPVVRLAFGANTFAAVQQQVDWLAQLRAPGLWRAWA